MTSATPAFCSARARCGFIPTAHCRHILGGAGFGGEGVDSAEVIGVAGVEKALDVRLRDPAQDGTPVHLSIDLTLQAAMEEVLARA